MFESNISRFIYYLREELAEKIDEKSERVKVLAEHLKNVKSELLNTQALIDEKNN